MVSLSRIYTSIFGRGCIGTNEKIEELERLLSPVEDDEEALSVQEFTHSTTINLVGLKCQTCADNIAKPVSLLPGVDPSSVVVSLIPPRLCLKHNQGITSIDQIEQTIKGAGYSTSKHKSTLISQPKAIGDRSGQAGEGYNVKIFNASFVIRSSELLDSDLDDILKGIDGVINFTYNRKKGRLHLEYNSSVVKKRSILEIIRSHGIVADIEEQTADLESISNSKVVVKTEFIRFIIGVVLYAPIFLFGMGSMFLPPDGLVMRVSEIPLAYGITVGDFIMLLSSTICQVALGYPFYTNAYKSLFYRHSLDMDVLISLGASVSYLKFVSDLFLTGSRGLVAKKSNFVESSVLLIVLITLGRCLEALACVNMSKSIGMLASLAPGVSVIIEEGPGKKVTETKIPTELMEVGDLCKVYRDTSFPCDGIIHSGTSLVDESSITGEPKLTFKGPGDKVMCGTVNTKFSVIVRAEKLGDQTALSRIIRLVEHAQSSQARIQTLANKICKYFLPIVVGLSVLTFFLWYFYLLPGEMGIVPADYTPFELSMTFAISVLVVACPCAIGLAMPTAAVMGAAICAKHGILTKGGSYVYEVASKLRAIAFDKTKTLTTGVVVVRNYIPLLGEPSVMDVDDTDGGVLSEIGLADMLMVLSKLASESSHPTGGPLLDLTNRELGCIKASGSVHLRTVSVSEVNENHGKGLSTVVNIEGLSCTYLACAGSYRWITENMDVSSTAPSLISEKEDEWKSEGYSIVYFAMARREDGDSAADKLPIGKLMCIIAFSDVIRPECRGVISGLSKLCIESYIITGDNAESAHNIAVKAGIPEKNVFGNSLPEKKASIIQELKDYYSGKDSSSAVAMVGDGINDSVALASSDMGIAMGVGSEIAIDCAKVILIKSDLRDLIIFLYLSREIYKRIKFNFFWAFAYNVISIPIAMGLLYRRYGLILQPQMAAVMMILSSLSVIINSLSLQFYKLRTDLM